MSNNCENGGFMNSRLYRKGLAIVLIIAILIMAAVGIKLSSKEKEIFITKNFDESELIKEVRDSTGYIYVDIDGAVNNPGVYQLSDVDRVNDAIIKAGGLKENAITKYLNKARKLTDGEKIYIFTEEELENSINSKLININTASMNDLMSLPGIGEVYAQRIIDYRSSRYFSSIEEIKNISGIGEKTYEKIKDLITIGE